MIKSPSKNLQLKFLKALIENRFISPGGTEYCEPEVRDLLMMKETALALRGYSLILKERGLVDHLALIRQFQERLLASLQLGIVKPAEASRAGRFSHSEAVAFAGKEENKPLSSNSANSNFRVETNLILPEFPTWVLTDSHHD